MSENDYNHWIRKELRQIPLPDGLLARLREIADFSDVDLDKELRAVSVPSQLLDRLRDIPADSELDRTVATVECPASLVERLTLIPDDVALDDQIANVEVPADLGKVTRRIPLPSPTWRRTTQWATALSLLVAVGLPYFFAMFGMISVAYEPNNQSDEGGVIYLQPTVDVVPVEPTVEIQLVRNPTVRDELPSRFVAPDRELLIGNDWPADNTFVALLGGSPEGEWSFADDTQLLRWMPLGAPPQADTVFPTLVTVPKPEHRGIIPSVTPGYDRGFLLKHGVHPVVVPTADLAISQVPISTNTDSYDLARCDLGHGRAPAPEDICVEDFLSGVSYDFAEPSRGDLGIRTAAGPSVSSNNGAKLLQVGVKARRLTDVHREPVHLTIAVDLSRDMGLQGRLPAVERAIIDLMRQLSPEDRVSLTTYGDEAFVLLENTGPADIDAVRQAVQQFETSGRSRFGDGVRQAMSVAVRAKVQNEMTSTLAVVHAGGDNLTEGEFRAINEVLTEGRDLDIVATLCDLTSSGSSLKRLAESTQQNYRAVDKPGDLQWMLLGCVTKASPLVAADVELQVQFNPKSVAGYRLIGHAPLAAGMGVANPAQDLRSQQEVTALYEIWLHPEASDDVAVATVAWRDPKTGADQQLKQRISRLQFAPSFAESAMSLQAATVAARTAEVLAGSYFAGASSRDLSAVITLAEEVNPRLFEQDSYQQLVEFAKKCQRTKSRRSRP